MFVFQFYYRFLNMAKLQRLLLCANVREIKALKVVVKKDLLDLI